MKLLKTAFVLLAISASAFAVSDSAAQTAYPDTSNKIKIWNQIVFPTWRGDAVVRLNVNFDSFDGDSDVLEIRNFVIYTDMGNFTYEGEYNTQFQVFATATGYKRTSPEDAGFIIFKATGEVNGVLYDLTGNLEVIPPPDITGKMEINLGGSTGAVRCVPGKTDTQVLEATFLDSEGGFQVTVRLDSGEATDLSFPGLYQIGDFDMAAGTRVTLVLDLTHSTDSSGSCVTEREVRSMTEIPK
jgi:hypothetical protein